jgi:proteasome accessory factor A
MPVRAKQIRGYPQRIMGLETEYCLVVKGPKNQAEVLRAIAGHNRRWLENGGCIYPDMGHIETCTPEVQSGYEAVVYDRAMEQVVRQKLRTLPYAGVIDTHLIKNNIGLDWTAGKATETTFGCHENYQIGVATVPARLVQSLAPYFITRQLFAGAGSVIRDGVMRRGETVPWRYELSQRARHVQQLTHGAATLSRGFIKTTTEGLGDPLRHQRLEVVLGDANILWEPAAYKFDLTSLMILMYENNAHPRLVLRASPALLLRQVAWQGPDALLELSGGGTLTAVAVQARYLEAALAFVERWQLTHFEPALRYWRDVVTALQAGDEAALFGRVDWATKRQLLHRAEARAGTLSWEQAFRRDLAYHDLTMPVANLAEQMRQRTDPVGLADAATIAMTQPPPGRPSLRSALIQLAKQQQASLELDWCWARFSRLGVGGMPKLVHMLDPYSNDPSVLEQARSFLEWRRAA